MSAEGATDDRRSWSAGQGGEADRPVRRSSHESGWGQIAERRMRGVGFPHLGIMPPDLGAGIVRLTFLRRCRVRARRQLGLAHPGRGCLEIRQGGRLI